MPLTLSWVKQIKFSHLPKNISNHNQILLPQYKTKWEVYRMVDCGRNINITSSFQSTYVYHTNTIRLHDLGVNIFALFFFFFSPINSLNLYMNIVLNIKEVGARCGTHVCTNTHRQIRGKMRMKIQLGNDEDRGSVGGRSEKERERNCHTNQHEMCSQEMPKSSTIFFRRNSTFCSTLCAVRFHPHPQIFPLDFTFFFFAGLPFARTIYSVRFFHRRLLHLGIELRRRTRTHKHEREKVRKEKRKVEQRYTEHWAQTHREIERQKKVKTCR